MIPKIGGCMILKNPPLRWVHDLRKSQQRSVLVISEGCQAGGTSAAKDLLRRRAAMEWKHSFVLLAIAVLTVAR